MKFNFFVVLFFLVALPGWVLAQNGTIRGNVFDQETGEPIIYGNVRIQGSTRGTNTDVDGFFSFADLPAGSYQLVATYLGYDSVAVNVQLKAGEIMYQRMYISPAAVELATVELTASRDQARSDVQVSKVTVTAKEIRALPSTGGEADIAQYLPVLPGIVVSGDQGGQVYIRGGSPVQNKILLDGMTIYNPFHSIGFFSVFETETIRSVDVYTGGFNAEYGGRISAIVDIKTREGNKKRLAGLVSASPFQVKGLVEGPIKPLDPTTGASSSFLLTGKHSYLDETSKFLYQYAVDTNFYNQGGNDSTFRPENLGLPFTFSDFYGKFSINGGNGSKVDFFGFNFNDNFAIQGVADLNWANSGGGASFTLIPPNSNVIMDGTISYSKYNISLKEDEGAPRQSGITTYNALLNFAYFGRNNQINYGFEFNGFNTDFSFQNFLGFNFLQRDFTTEMSGYVKYKHKIGNLIIEPGLRLQFYASQSKMSLEPRIGIKYNATEWLRFKAAGGLYSQNLIGTVNDLDIVNFFVGFLAGPEETIYKPASTEVVDDRLQHAVHGVAGMEVDLGNHTTVNAEAYYKGFTQLIAINRNKLNASDPNFITETGFAYGIDFSLKYDFDRTYIWATYSLGNVRRNDGEQEYPTHFDRRHNVNLLLSYQLGEKKEWEAGVRWNMGSGFPFTQTQGFYQGVTLQDDPLLTNFLTGNYNLDVLLSPKRNGGRLPYFHRLDVSLKRHFQLSKNASIDAVFSVTNAYNRKNVFFVDRITNDRVNQLPILPSLGVTFNW